MPQQPGLFRTWQWHRRIRRMKGCATPEELLERCGKPERVFQGDDVDIWHYPLREIGGTVYSIHVAFTDGGPVQVYLHLEPAAEA